jgi:hypothetical protein
MDTLKRPQLHATGLNMACGEAFRRRYIEGEIIPPGVAAVVGIATDKAVSRNLEHKRETKELLPLDELAEIARDGLEETWERGGGVRLDPEEAEAGIPKVKGQATDKTVRLSVLHAVSTAGEIEPTHIQRQWAVAIPGYPFDLVGTIDIQEGAAAVRDTKTTAKSPPADAAAKSLQLAAYSLAVKVLDGRAPEKVKLDYLVDNKKPLAVTLEATKGADDYNALLARIETLTLAIERGVFMPVSPDHWACSERFCGYARTCRYFIRRPAQLAVAAPQGEL